MTPVAKINFESTEDFKVTLHMEGTKASLRAAAHSILNQIAVSENITTMELLESFVECEKGMAEMEKDFKKIGAEDRARFEKFVADLFGVKEKQ